MLTVVNKVINVEKNLKIIFKDYPLERTVPTFIHSIVLKLLVYMEV